MSEEELKILVAQLEDVGSCEEALAIIRAIASINVGAYHAAYWAYCFVRANIRFQIKR